MKGEERRGEDRRGEERRGEMGFRLAILLQKLFRRSVEAERE
jgi:hypothetical protein